MVVVAVAVAVAVVVAAVVVVAVVVTSSLQTADKNLSSSMVKTFPVGLCGVFSSSTRTPPSRRRDCHSAAPPSPFSRRINRDEEEVSTRPSFC